MAAKLRQIREEKKRGTAVCCADFAVARGRMVMRPRGALGRRLEKRREAMKGVPAFLAAARRAPCRWQGQRHATASCGGEGLRVVPLREAVWRTEPRSKIPAKITRRSRRSCGGGGMRVPPPPLMRVACQEGCFLLSPTCFLRLVLDVVFIAACGGPQGPGGSRAAKRGAKRLYP